MRFVAIAGVCFLVWVVGMRWIPPPGTPLMVQRLVQGHGLAWTWLPLRVLPPHVPRAFVASEDARFCLHSGVDAVELREAVRSYRDGERIRGASTVSMQTAKNVFLLPVRSKLRKGIELPLTGLLEGLWGKRRILEVYLNVAELGPGVYGIEAGAQHHFGVSAAQLTPAQAARLAAVLPDPLHRDASASTPYMRKREQVVVAGIRLVDGECWE